MGNPINHGTKNDFNIIVDLTYDKAGRRTSLRDPRGNLTEYDYDLLNRRVELTNPLSKTWTTAYADLGGGGSRTTLTDPNGINTQRDFDRAGRVQSIQFGNPSNTPDVQFAYDEAGNRERMSEFSGSGFTSKVRETTFTYDNLRRVTAVDFDTDGNGSVEESVAYEYDAAGLKTSMTLPGSLEITYDYDANGRLIGMTDWDAQTSEFGYDLSGRHIVTQQDNGLRSRYSYDADGRLITLRHTAGERTLGHFAYHYDKRGNRIRAFEALPHPATISDTTLAYNDDAVEYRGTWTNSAPYKQTTVFGASLKLAFFGTDATLTVGTGVNHTRFDIYINRQLWQTVDGYAASNGTLAIPIALENEGPHLLEIRNRPQHSQAAKQDGSYDPAVYKLSFKQLLVPDIAYDLHTIEYVYDALSRVEDVAYYAGRNLTATPFRSHAYTYDRLGNRLSASLNGAGATNYTYNAANQLTSDGTNSYTYDNNGNLTNDGVNTHTWDRANRLKSVGSHSYTYDGLGNRVKKTVSGTATGYLHDLNSGLVQVLAQTTGANTDRVLYGPRGVQAFEDNSGDWSFMLPDALGSVRSQVDDILAIAGMRNFAPYGDPFGEQGSFAGDYGFTGEQTDANDLLYLRARYYNPNMSTFITMDAMEGSWDNPLTINGYGYVGGNPINHTDPTGMFWSNASNLMKPNGSSSAKQPIIKNIQNKATTVKMIKDNKALVKPVVVKSSPQIINNDVKSKTPLIAAVHSGNKIDKLPSLPGKPIGVKNGDKLKGFSSKSDATDPCQNIQPELIPSSHSQRSEIYETWDQCLHQLGSPFDDITFFYATANVTSLLAIGDDIPTHIIVTPYDLFSSLPRNEIYEDLLRPLGPDLHFQYAMNVIGAHLFEENQHVINDLLATYNNGETTLRSPYNNEIVNSGFEFDIHMVYNEQITVQEAIDDLGLHDNTTDSASIMLFFGGTGIVPLGNTDYIDWAQIAVEESPSGGYEDFLGYNNNINFATESHRRALGIAYIFQNHDLTLEQYLYYMQGTWGSDIPPEVGPETIPHFPLP